MSREQQYFVLTGKLLDATIHLNFSDKNIAYNRMSQLVKAANAYWAMVYPGEEDDPRYHINHEKQVVNDTEHLGDEVLKITEEEIYFED